MWAHFLPLTRVSTIPLTQPNWRCAAYTTPESVLYKYRGRSSPIRITYSALKSTAFVGVVYCSAHQSCWCYWLQYADETQCLMAARLLILHREEMSAIVTSDADCSSRPRYSASCYIDLSIVTFAILHAVNSSVKCDRNADDTPVYGAYTNNIRPAIIIPGIYPILLEHALLLEMNRGFSGKGYDGHCA